MARISDESAGWAPSPCRASAMPGLAGGYLEVLICALSHASSAQGRWPRCFRSCWSCRASAAKCPTGCSWALHVLGAHALGMEPLLAAHLATLHAALLLLPCFSSACKRWIFIINELPLLQPCYLKRCPINKVFGLVAAWLLNSTWQISAWRWVTSPSSPHSQPGV